MNKGCLSAWPRKARPWVYIPFNTNVDAVNNSGVTGDINLTECGVTIPTTAVPVGAKVRALELKMFGRSDTLGNAVMGVYDWDDTNNVIGVGMGNGRGYSNYYGNTTGAYHYMSATVRTQHSRGQERFKYAVNWVAGTNIIIIRAIGAWVELP